MEQRIGDVLANFVTAKGPSLRLLLGLWKTMAEICESSWWHHPANAILQAPRKHPMNLDSEKLEAWSSVVELLHTYSTDVQHLRDLVMSECMLTARIRGMVWNHVGSKLVDSPPPRWASEDLLFCLVPVGSVSYINLHAIPHNELGIGAWTIVRGYCVGISSIWLSPTQISKSSSGLIIGKGEFRSFSR